MRKNSKVIKEIDKLQKMFETIGNNVVESSSMVTRQEYQQMLQVMTITRALIYCDMVKIPEEPTKLNNGVVFESQ